MNSPINLHLSDLHPANLAYLNSLAKKWDVSDESVAEYMLEEIYRGRRAFRALPPGEAETGMVVPHSQLLDRHIRALRYFDPGEICDPVAETEGARGGNLLTTNPDH